MKSQWKLYRELELIPDSVGQPKPRLLDRLVRPIRRSLARSFVKDLSHKHRVLLFERCLGLDKSGQSLKKRSANVPTTQPLDAMKPSRQRVIARSHELKSQQGLNRGVLSWWGWSNQ
jgi:hypothetical protein